MVKRVSKRYVLNLDRAIEIAVKAHEGQIDKAGKPYVLHPLRVMLRMDSRVGMIAGVLHDVLEDGGENGWTRERLTESGFGGRILATLDRLTKQKGEDYFDFVRRAAGRALSRKVKIADLQDNMDLSRIPCPEPKDQKRVRKYRKAMRLLCQISEQKVLR
jgi:(p)ppGpp synthase/HD superfamily hydrolase